MTESEAIEKLRAYHKCQRLQVKGIYEDCNEKLCDNCDLCYAQGTNGEQIELMLQCAEWLEELKVIKKMDLSIPQHFTKEQSDWIKKYCINRNKEFYIMALDDFMKFASDMPTVETEDGTIRPMWLEEMAERLKGQNK